MSFISPSKIEGVAKNLTPFLRKTPLQRGTGTYKNLYLKREDLQITNSFTVRAAFGILMGLSQQQREQGIVLTTPGNLGWGLAYALQCLKLSIKLHIVIPEDAVDSKRAGLMALSSNQISVTQKGKSEIERYEVVREIARREGLLELDLHNREDEVAAKGTIALETVAQIENPLDQQQVEFYCPIGSGALATGCAIWLKHRFGDRARIIGAEPTSANDFARLFHKNERSTNSAPSTIADSLRSPSVRTEYQATLLDLVDDVIEVTDAEALDEMKRLYSELEIVSEPSSIISVGAALKSAASKSTIKICLLTAANIDRTCYEFFG